MRLEWRIVDVAGWKREVNRLYVGEAILGPEKS